MMDLVLVCMSNTYPMGGGMWTSSFQTICMLCTFCSQLLHGRQEPSATSLCAGTARHATLNDPSAWWYQAAVPKVRCTSNCVYNNGGLQLMCCVALMLGMNMCVC
jgi:hypothetical protein